MRCSGLLIAVTLAWGLIPLPTWAEDSPETITLWQRNYTSPPIYRLVELALEKTPEFGPAVIEPSLPMSQARALVHLEQGNRSQIRVANVATSPAREEKLQPIAIPVDRGLLGFRVCLIRKGEQQRFDNILTSAQWQEKGLSIGQGAHWPDTAILRASGFNVITSPRFENLFGMLERGRFDCFLRGIGEILMDLEGYEGDELTVEENLVFSYPLSSYLFVAPDDIEMAHRLELGLRRAIENGAYDAFFDSYFRQPIQEMGLFRRTFIPLENPMLGVDEKAPVLPMIPVRPEEFQPFPADGR